MSEGLADLSGHSVRFVSYDDSPSQGGQGGQGVYLVGLRRAVEGLGVATTTVAGLGRDAIRFPRITGRAPLDLSIHLNRHREVLTAPVPLIVHAMGGPGGILLVRELSVPLVYTAHHTYRQAYARTRLQRSVSILEARAYRHAAMVLPVSPATADAVHALGVPAKRIEVIPPGVDIPPTLDEGARDPSRLLFVGRLEREKGVLDAIAVMSALAASHGATGAIIGVGRLAEDVRRLVGRGGGQIEYLGAVDDATLRREYGRAAILVMPSRYEGLGLVALEAMGHGVAVVAYEGVRDAVAGGGGVLVPVADGVEGLRRASAALLDDPARRGEVAAAGRAKIEREHSWERAGSRVIEIYRAVAGGEWAEVEAAILGG